MRLIDKDALGLTDMEIIMCDGDYKKALEMLIDKIEYAPTIELEDRERCGECDAWNQYKNYPQKSQWIPCSERLPQPNEEAADGFIKAYLVQDGRWMDVARWNGDCWIAWGYGTALTNVIAWMPLPEPYRK